MPRTLLLLKLSRVSLHDFKISLIRSKEKVEDITKNWYGANASINAKIG